jgi:outer membrane protein, adhesin transport system
MKIRILVSLLVALAPATRAIGQVASPNSLPADPQQGATPRPVIVDPQVETLPPQGAIEDTALEAPLAAPVLQPLDPPPQIPFRQPDVTLETSQQALPTPVADPLNIDRSTDPVLALAESTVDPATFSSAIRMGVQRHPSLAEAEADRAEVEAQRNEARAAALPFLDLNLTYFRVLDRQFSNDPQNILERSRPRERTDAQVQLTAPVFDFGRTGARIDSANERLAATEANLDDYSSRLAQSSISAWYQVFSYRALVRLGEAFVANQNELRAALEKRVEQGASAPADLAQYNGYRAAAQAQLADFRRQLSAAEAQYAAYIGQPASPDLGRGPAAHGVIVTPDSLDALIGKLPVVQRARRLLRSARYDTEGAKAQMLPSVTVGLNAGRYGVFETERDYDIRASVTLNQRLFGGVKQRADQAVARESRAQATYDRVRLEAGRDAQIAYADVLALQQSSAALRENYFASRQARDALFERFRLARGTLNDVLTAQTNYFNVAVRYVVAVNDLDIARYVLLARTGELLNALDIERVGGSIDE